MMKNFYRYIKNALTGGTLLGAIIGVTSCSETDGPGDSPYVTPVKESTLLVYAVATNSLTGNLVSDKNEMLQAASEIDLDQNNVIVFETQYQYLQDNSRVGNVNLLKLVKDSDGSYSWEVVKDFNDGIASLNPERMKQVIDYVAESFPAEEYGLVLWSHSTGSQPNFPSTETKTVSSADGNSFAASLPSIGWYGQDLTVEDENYKYMNIDVLANTLPDNFFNYIWFDSCLMSNIESIYQLRNKCKTFVAYPTEVLDAGLPYHYVLPFMVGKNPELIHAAELFFEYYSNSFGTIAVLDMEKIDVLTDYCKELFEKGNQPSISSLVKYSRYSTGPFYDFGDYIKAMAELTGTTVSQEELNEVLDQCILYKATTDGSLLRLSINKDTYSGISTHLYSFGEDDSENEAYYKSLDWFQAVFN